MRNIHKHIRSEYGIESVRLLCRWERIEGKMSDFKNHRRFSLQCLSNDVIPVSIRLKSNIKTPKGQEIIRRAEKALLNERIRSINNIIYMFNLQKDTCITNLANKIKEEDLKYCEEFIEARREARHYKTMERQKKKLERLCQKNSTERGGCSNQHGDNTCINTENLDISPADSSSNTNNKWVINISSKPLTKAQEKLLAHGPNYAVVSKSPPIAEYIAAIEQACSKLKQGEAEELGGKSNLSSRGHATPPPNITREERKAIRELKEDKSRMVLTADKGVALVVIDTEKYKKKAQELLQQPTYQPIPTDPTSKYKNKLINMLKTIKAEGGITEAVYKKLYPTGAGSPKFYGLPKIHKEGVPLRPIVSSIGAVTYHTSKELSRIIKPLVGRSPYHIQNSKDFIQQIQGIQLQPNQCMVSFDVKALFTSVPIQPAITIIKKLLEEDQSLQQRTTMSVNQHHLPCWNSA